MRRWILILGDLIVFLLFAYLGKTAHGQTGFTLYEIVQTAFPFAVGWLFVGSMMNVFAEEATQRSGNALRTTFKTWLVAGPASLALWGILHVKVPHWSFALVAFTVSLVLLLIWRGLFGFVVSRLSK